MSVNYFASTVVEEALRLAGMTESNAIPWASKTRLLNASYSKVYHRLTQSANRPWVKSFILEGSHDFLPRDFKEIHAVRRYVNDAEWSPHKLRPTSHTGEGSPGQYTIRNHSIHVAGGGPWLVEYVPLPDSKTFAAKPHPIEFEGAPIRMDHDHLIMDVGTGFAALAFDTGKTFPVNGVFSPRVDYMDFVNIKLDVKAQTLKSSAEDLTDWFLNPAKSARSFAVAGPYLYVNYGDGSVEGFEGYRRFVYDPFEATMNKSRVEVLAGWTNDLTGYGLVVKTQGLVGPSFCLAGFAEDSRIDHPVNAYWDFLALDLAVRFAQANQDVNEQLMLLYNDAQSQFNIQMARAQNGLNGVNRQKGYR